MMRKRVLIFVWVIAFWDAGSIGSQESWQPKTQLKWRSTEFKALPDTTRLALLEQWCWEERSADRGRAYEYGIQALRLAQQLEDKRHEAKILNYLGVILRDAHNFEGAGDFFDEALQVSLDNGIVLEKAYALNNLGNLAHLKGEYRRALNYIDQALEQAKALGHKTAMAYCYFQMGLSYQGLNQLDSALTCNFKALELRKEVGMHAYVSASMRDIAELYQAQGHLNLERAFLLQSIDYLKQYPSHTQSALTYLQLGRYYLQTDSLNKAEDAYFTALNISGGERSWEWKKIAAEQLARIFDQLGSYKKALDYQKQVSAFSDSLALSKSAIRINDLTLSYLYEKEKEVIKTRQAEKERRIRFWVLALGTGLGLVVVIVLLLMRQNRIRHKNNLKLARMNELILTQKASIEQTSKELEESNRTKDKFFSIIAHDLKSPFNAILHYSQTLKDEVRAGRCVEVAEAVETIFEASQHSYALIDNLLEWSRTQTGRIKYEPEIFDIHDVIQESIQFSMPAFRKKGVTLQTEIESGILITADYHMMQTVMRNLLSNACKFSYGGGTVCVTAIRKSFGIDIAVADEGVGIPHERQVTLFDLDQTQSSVGTSGETGTGLGLMLCKEFVEQNGGHIAVDSTPGKGTIFTVSLPLPVDVPVSDSALSI